MNKEIKIKTPKDKDIDDLIFGTNYHVHSTK